MKGYEKLSILFLVCAVGIFALWGAPYTQSFVLGGLFGAVIGIVGSGEDQEDREEQERNAAHKAE